MPQIIVTAYVTSDQDEGPVTLKERISPADLESRHFQAHLVERLGWAVNDAKQVEQEHQ
jgi:hypothetical protein